MPSKMLEQVTSERGEGLRLKKGFGVLMSLRMPERPVHMLSAPCIPALLLLHQSIKIALSRTFTGDEVRDGSSDTSVRQRWRNKNTAACLPSVLNKELRLKLNAHFSLYTKRN